MRIGVDAGGTFTDFVVLHDDGRLDTFKLRSDPHEPAKVILAGLERAAASADVVHGSTVATNALLERKGARTAFVTTAGFEDLLEIGRQNRAELYNLTPAPRQLLADPCAVFRRARTDLSRWRRRLASVRGRVKTARSEASARACEGGRHLLSALLSKSRERASGRRGIAARRSISLHI